MATIRKERKPNKGGLEMAGMPNKRGRKYEKAGSRPCPGLQALL
jgi:hypothetical protein